MSEYARVAVVTLEINGRKIRFSVEYSKQPVFRGKSSSHALRVVYKAFTYIDAVDIGTCFTAVLPTYEHVQTLWIPRAGGVYLVGGFKNRYDSRFYKKWALYYDKATLEAW